jgi:hypothetical protein
VIPVEAKFTPQPLQCHDIVAFFAKRFAQQHLRTWLARNQYVRQIHPVRMKIEAQPAGKPTFTEQIHGFLSRIAPNWPKLAYFPMLSNTYNAFLMCVNEQNRMKIINPLISLGI